MLLKGEEPIIINNLIAHNKIEMNIALQIL